MHRVVGGRAKNRTNMVFTFDDVFPFTNSRKIPLPVFTVKKPNTLMITAQNIFEHSHFITDFNVQVLFIMNSGKVLDNKGYS